MYIPGNERSSFNITNKPIDIPQVNRTFNPQHITMDEGEVKEIHKDQIATYPNVNSCFTITAVLDDGNMVGAHLVTPSEDEIEKKRRLNAGIREAKDVLPEMASLIGNRQIKELIVAGSLQESKQTTRSVKTIDPDGNEILKDVEYMTDSWKGSDIIPAIKEKLDGPNIITGLISCYFEKNLLPYTNEENGFKAQNHATSIPALVTISNEHGKTQVEIRDQVKYDQDPKANSNIIGSNDCYTHYLIKDQDSYNMWMGLKDYWE